MKIGRYDKEKNNIVGLKNQPTYYEACPIHATSITITRHPC
jgi:hypothetical protein